MKLIDRGRKGKKERSGEVKNRLEEGGSGKRKRDDGKEGTEENSVGDREHRRRGRHWNGKG